MSSLVTLIIALTLVGCGNSKADRHDPTDRVDTSSVAPPSTAAHETCERASTQYYKCVKEMLGPDVGDPADGIVCESDPKLAKMYETCLPKTACKEFMDCIQDYSAKNL
jgi:hypothetical protein